jgi:hypothetical protein
MKKGLVVFFSIIALIILPNYFTNASCYYADWKEVKASYTTMGGDFILMCPADGIQKCCVAKSEGKSLKRGN